MLRTSSKTKDNFVQVRIEMNGIDVKGFSLTREHNEHYLDGVQTLTIIKLVICNEVIENFNQVGEKVHVDRMREPV
jgi:hypothetical protein